jgi:dihydroorotase
MSSLLIINADVVNEGRRFEADVLIEDGRIAAVGKDLQARPRTGSSMPRGGC